MTLVTEAIVRHRPVRTATDPGGNEVVTQWVDRTIDGVAIAPRESAETFQPGRSPVVNGLTVYGPIGMDLDARDEVTARGQRWAVDGDVAAWNPPAGSSLGGTVVNLRRARG